MPFFRKKPFDVFTHHKCASTWLRIYLERFCGTNGLTFGSTHFSDRLPEVDGDVRLLLNADYDFVTARKLSGLHVIRSPFALLSSAYHSHKTTHPVENWPQLVPQRAVLNAVSEHDGYMLTIAFIERPRFDHAIGGPFAALRKWDFDDPRYETLRMEDTVRDVTNVIGQRLLRRFGPRCTLPPTEDFAFEAFAGARAPGQVDAQSHYRSGDPLQWKRDLPASAVTYVSTHFADLVAAYYPEQAG